MRGTDPQGEQIRRARLQKAWTQTELARNSGLDVKTVRKAEQGKRIDSVPLFRLAAALEIDVARLTAPRGDETDLGQQRQQKIFDWVKAFESRDIEAVLICFHDDAVLRMPGSPDVPCSGVFRGKKMIRQAHAIAWARPQEPVRVEGLSFHAVGNTITMVGDKGYYTPGGELFMLRAMHLFTFRELLLSEYEIQYDTLDFVRRMAFDPSERRE